MPKTDIKKSSNKNKYYKPVILVQSFRKKSKDWGWSCSTDWDTSIIYASPSWYLKLKNKLMNLPIIIKITYFEPNNTFRKP